MVQTTALEQSLLLRTHPTLGPPVLRDFLGERWFPVWYEAHAVALQTHPEDPLLHGRTLTDLQGLSAWRPLTADDYAIQTALFFVRGRTRWLTGASTMGDARADLQRAVATAPAVLERALEQQDAEGIVQSTRILVDGHALLASLFLASGDEAAALVHVEASLKWAPSPTVAIDRLLLDDRVRAQRLDPAWATLLGGADATP